MKDFYKMFSAANYFISSKYNELKGLSLTSEILGNF